MKFRRTPATPYAGKYSSHLHANRPSDQLSRRTPCLTLVHEMSAAAHPLAPTLRRPDASNTRTQMERISLRACWPRTQRLTDALATSQLSTVAHRHSANPSRAPKAQKCVSLSPSPATLTHYLSRKSFACHSYANTRDRGVTTPPNFCGGTANRNSDRRLFSRSYKSLFPQLLYFHIHAKPQGVYPGRLQFFAPCVGVCLEPCGTANRIAQLLPLLSFPLRRYRGTIAPGGHSREYYPLL